MGRCGENSRKREVKKVDEAVVEDASPEAERVLETTTLAWQAGCVVASYRGYVVLKTGNERGSNGVVVTRVGLPEGAGKFRTAGTCPRFSLADMSASVKAPTCRSSPNPNSPNPNS